MTETLVCPSLYEDFSIMLQYILVKKRTQNKTPKMAGYSSASQC